MMENTAPCPCGSGSVYGECCGPLHGGAAASSAAALMRSRYTAYMLGNADYLLESWHPSTRPAAIELNNGPRWTGLEMRAVESNDAEANEATVEFVAHYADGPRRGTMRETSYFRREGGRWYYLDGRIHPAEATKIGRNEPCPCGSGAKYKRCCGS